jgi:Zn-dependent protease
MSFRLFGVNVTVQPFFWLITVLLGMGDRMDMTTLTTVVPVWVAVVFVSILVHEYGHAFAVKRLGIEPEITLHGMGGTTTFSVLLPISRRDRVIISLAGPLAGFALAAVVIGLHHFVLSGWRAPALLELAYFDLLWVNIGWGVVNLVPVLPFDGGHVLEHLLGPKRIRATALISTAVGIAVALYFLKIRAIWGAMLFAMGAMRSYQRYVVSQVPVVMIRPASSVAPRAISEPIPPRLVALLRSAREALAHDDLVRALSLARQVLDGDGGAVPVTPRAHQEALEISAWAELLAGQHDAAADLLQQSRRFGEPEVALSAAVLMAQNDLARARELLEAARAHGDDRKEIVGPLIQVLIRQGEVARATGVAVEIADTLSDEDARKMAHIAYDNTVFEGAARLFEVVFEREKLPDDAYDAARARAQQGQSERALDLLRRAIEAGFSDRARAWSDAAFETLRAGSGLEALLPRP